MIEKDLAIVLAWPEKFSKGQEPIFKFFQTTGLLKNRYFRAGHAGIILIKRETGALHYFDFGRYTTPYKVGRARGKNTDPKLEIPITAKFDSRNKLVNFNEIVKLIGSMTDKMRGKGTLHFSICSEINFEKSMEYVRKIQMNPEVKYDAFSGNNCAQFVRNVLLAGLDKGKTKIRLLYPWTLLRATPIGNVEAVNSQKNYLLSEDGKLTVKNRKTRWGVVKHFYEITAMNFSPKTTFPDFGNSLVAPAPFEGLSKDAQWLSGLGEGTWLTLKNIEKGTNKYIITAQNDMGETEYEFVSEIIDKDFSAHKPFKFVYPATNLWVTIEQNGKQFKIKNHKSYNTYTEERTVQSENKSL